MKEIFVEIKGLGFVFHCDNSIGHNLISPAFLAFFKEDYSSIGELKANQEAIKKFYAESSEAFPVLPENLHHYSFVGIFRQLDSNIIRCSDNRFRKCKSIKLNFIKDGMKQSKVFYVDNSLWKTKKVNVLLWK